GGGTQGDLPRVPAGGGGRGGDVGLYRVYMLLNGHSWFLLSTNVHFIVYQSFRKMQVKTECFGKIGKSPALLGGAVRRPGETDRRLSAGPDRRRLGYHVSSSSFPSYRSVPCTMISSPLRRAWLFS